MKVTTKSRTWQVLVWLFWFLLAFVVTWSSGILNQGDVGPSVLASTPLTVLPSETHLLDGLVGGSPRLRLLFPWWPRFRWRKLALMHYQAWTRRLRRARRAHRRAVWIARLARLVLSGAIPFAAVVFWLTQAQLRHCVGAIPVLYAVLEVLDVRNIINRHCPKGRAHVDYGAVAIVLIVNRLIAPCAQSRVAGWLNETILPEMLGVPARKFNDDRLARALDKMWPHLREIWIDIVDRAIEHFGVDLSIVFHDLTAFVVHGEYKGSELAEFGFAHNTPMGKRKIKLGLNTTRDGNFPLDYSLYTGNTADVTAVKPNLERLHRLRTRHGHPIQEILVVGDRANLNDELAFVYDRRKEESGLVYLAGLEPRKKAHKALLVHYPDRYFYRHPLKQEGYYAIPCKVTFELKKKRKTIKEITHRGLIVLSQPMQRAQRRTRAQQFRALRQELSEVQARIGRPYYRTVAAVQERANTRLRNSPVGKLMQAWAFEEGGRIQLRWRIDRQALKAVTRRDGRYLLVTNHPTLTPNQMLALYRGKDGCEKRFTVCKKDLLVSPIYLHKDNRIEAMLLVNMLALLAYSVLERQSRQHGLALTARRMIDALESLTIIETRCWDGSILRLLAPVNKEQRQLLQALGKILEAMRWPQLKPTLPPVPPEWIPASLSPGPLTQTTDYLLPLPTS